jgi:hypothetical protein
MADADGMVFWYNQRWFDYSGTTIADMKGWGWKKIHHPDHLQRHHRKIASSQVKGKTASLGNDDLYRWFLSYCTYLANGMQ